MINRSSFRYARNRGTNAVSLRIRSSRVVASNFHLPWLVHCIRENKSRNAKAGVPQVVRSALETHISRLVRIVKSIDYKRVLKHFLFWFCSTFYSPFEFHLRRFNFKDLFRTFHRCKDSLTIFLRFFNHYTLYKIFCLIFQVEYTRLYQIYCYDNVILLNYVYLILISRI